jgi:hypothetical protein
MLRRAPQRILVLALTFVPLGVSCFPEVPELDGSCRVEPASRLDCRAPGYGDDLLEAGLLGYSCTGSARPDLDAVYDEGVPSGSLCAHVGELEDSGREGYCCTEQAVECVYDPVGNCDGATYGVQCWGGNRPESLNPRVRCTNGNRQGEFTRYCCEERDRYADIESCQQIDSVGCSQQQLGFLCPAERLPRGEDLGPNKSRADYFHPVCTTPEPAPNPEYETYCCYMPAQVLIGGSCVNDTEVPGCEPGRFGFACYGPETPEDDYSPMHCPEPAISGVSAEGYAAKLYCCDFLPE